MLRNQVADKLDQTKANLEAIRKDMASRGEYESLSRVGSLISQVQELGGEVRHAAQGYSGLAASIRFDESKLNSLYEYDYNFVNAAVQLSTVSSPSAINASDQS